NRSSSASAGGQLEQPSEVKSSITATPWLAGAGGGAAFAACAEAAPTIASSNPPRRIMLVVVLRSLPDTAVSRARDRRAAATARTRPRAGGDFMPPSGAASARGAAGAGTSTSCAHEGGLECLN